VSEERSVRETAREEGGGRKRDGGINGEKRRMRKRLMERGDEPESRAP